MTLNLVVANTDATREQGLSDKVAMQGDPLGLGLGENEAMLFIFDKAGYYSFWMKDMNFSIDMAWIDENKKITYIAADVSPATYPRNFSSPVSNLYVLETPAGFFAKNNVKIGESVAF